MTRHFSLRRIRALFAQTFFAVGVLWTTTQIVAFLSTDAGKKIGEYWWGPAAVALGWGLFASWPRSRFLSRVAMRDVSIELVVGDIFNEHGCLVVPTNCAFDASLLGRVARAASVQGALLREYYSNKPEHLQNDIGTALAGIEPSTGTTLVAGRELATYEIGTAISLSQKGTDFCLLATTRLNDHGAATADVGDLYTALSRLWFYLSNKGEKATVVVPVLGTGQGRLPIERDRVVRAIIRSFLASCSERAYCDRLVIVLHPKDVRRHGVDVEALSKFLAFSCEYAPFDPRDTPPTGQGIE